MLLSTCMVIAQGKWLVSQSIIESSEMLLNQPSKNIDFLWIHKTLCCLFGLSYVVALV